MPGQRTRGFTLIELMVTLAVMAIVLAFAFPSFEGIINGNKLSSAANEMMASLQTARMESLRFNKRGVVCFSANPNAAAPTCSTVNPTGWITFLDADKSNAYNAGDTLLRRTQVDSKVKILGSTNVGGLIRFRSEGIARDTAGNLLKGAIDMCIPTRQPRTNDSRVTIMSGSRVSVAKIDTNPACAAPANPT